MRRNYDHAPSGPLVDRFLANYVEMADGSCWEWTGACALGYGVLSASGINIRAHRVSYALFTGPLTDHDTVDHLCENKRCVNPDHLERVSRGENARRWYRRHRRTCPHSAGAVRDCKHCANDAHARRRDAR